MRVIVVIGGFIAGLIISGILGDAITAVKISAGKVSTAWNISKAQRAVASGNFFYALNEYKKAVNTIDPNNKKLLAKTKNNMALVIFNIAKKEQNKEGIRESLEIFLESLSLYEEIGDNILKNQVRANIEAAKSTLEKF